MGRPRHTIRKNFKNKYLLEKKHSVLDVLEFGWDNIRENFLCLILPIVINIFVIVWSFLSGYFNKLYEYLLNGELPDGRFVIFLCKIVTVAFIMMCITIAYYIALGLIYGIFLLSRDLYQKWCAVLQQRYLPISEQDLEKNNIKTTDDYWECMECILRVGNVVFPIFNDKMYNQCEVVYKDFFQKNDFYKKIYELRIKK